MKDIIEKYKRLEKQMAEEKGAFNLFALSLLENSMNRWDLLISASWILDNREKELRYVVSKLQETLSAEEFAKLSRIVLIEKNSPVLDALNKTALVKHGNVEIQDKNLFGLEIKRAHIITSTKPEEPQRQFNALKP